jgi:DNA-binding NarL/FixJ family response regulator
LSWRDRRTTTPSTNETALAPQDAVGAGSAPGLLVVDPDGRFFTALRQLDLGTAIWRTVRAPLERNLPPSIVVLYVVEAQPPWDEIAESARIWPTIVVTERPVAADATAALRAGAFGYLDAGMAPDVLRRTLLGALRGEPAYRREAIGSWLREGRSSAPAPRSTRTDRLTARQREIIGLIAGGATDKEIASALGIRTATAQKHVANLLRRLGVRNRAAAVGLLLKDGRRLPPTAQGTQPR